MLPWQVALKENITKDPYRKSEQEPNEKYEKKEQDNPKGRIAEIRSADAAGIFFSPKLENIRLE